MPSPIRYVLALFLSLVFILPVNADVKIPKECWVKNKPGGYCGYAALECVGRFYKNPNLYGLVEYFSQWPSVGMSSANARECLDYQGVKYHIYENANIRWLKEQVDKEIPVTVGCWWTIGQHAIVVVDLDEKWVKYIDSNDITKYHYVNREWFDWSWTGWAIRVYKE